ncbi:LysR family transcriptional regulator [Agromyces allii]|uniref:HTH lysR-type domain-containing protein n=1 Tax=Agromyces allii TaxID=393607 RepID=A0ABP5BQP3_9MICO|nr:LysR family transcriptional regulator [Agromyces allii]
MKIAQLERFVAIVDADVHVPRAAEALGVPLASLYSTIDKLEEETGMPLFTRAKSGWGLTEAGALLLDEAHRRIAEAPAVPDSKPAVPAGGKAKASKGKGRAPIVKGEPKPYKKRQGR